MQGYGYAPIHCLASTALTPPTSSAASQPHNDSTWQPLASQYLPSVPTALAFDPVSPLLFAASPQGTVASYFCSPTTGLAGRYTSYRAHAGPVGEAQVDSTGILSVGGGGVRAGVGGSVKMATRRGVALWTIECVVCLSQRYLRSRMRTLIEQV